MTKPYDPRITPARSDLAAAHLAGSIEAAHFVEGKILHACAGVTALRRAPDDAAGLDTQILYGEAFTIYEEKNGWLWGQTALDDYVGYTRAEAFDSAQSKVTHRVSALATPLLPGPDVKLAARALLPMNAKLAIARSEVPFAVTEDGFYVFAGHVMPLSEPAPDWVSAAEHFLGVPYLWGGKTAAGLDCSGLVQTALEAGGIESPRDTDMMEATLGHALNKEITALARGDLIFWKGHVGIMRDNETLLHANVFAMEVSSEPLREARARIGRNYGPITNIKRF